MTARRAPPRRLRIRPPADWIATPSHDAEFRVVPGPARARLTALKRCLLAQLCLDRERRRHGPDQTARNHAVLTHIGKPSAPPAFWRLRLCGRLTV